MGRQFWSHISADMTTAVATVVKIDRLRAPGEPSYITLRFVLRYNQRQQHCGRRYCLESDFRPSSLGRHHRRLQIGIQMSRMPLPAIEGYLGKSRSFLFWMLCIS